MDITKIFLKFGNACNLHCIYCLHQKASKQDFIYSEDFIKSLPAKYPYASYILIGGEPLLYKNNIRKTIDDILPDKNISITTNGSLLDDEWISYFNAHDNVKICISWDGTASALTRGYDAAANNRKAMVNIKNLAVLSLITNDSFIIDKLTILDDINKERMTLGNKPLKFDIKLTYGLIYKAETIKRIKTEAALIRNHSIDCDAAYAYVDSVKHIKRYDYHYSCGANLTDMTFTVAGQQLKCSSIDDNINVTEPNINPLAEFCETCPVANYCPKPCNLLTQDYDNFCLASKTYYTALIG